MEKTEEELLGSLVRVAKAECGPVDLRRIVRFIKRICRKWRNSRITIVCIDEVRFDIGSLAKREIAQLIMEYNDHNGEKRL